MVSTERTGPHRQVEDLLRQMGIAFQSEVPVGRYQLDLYLPEWHLAIEVDGLGHSRRRDADRDAYLLREHGIPTLRLQPPIRAPRVRAAIREFIEFQAPVTGARRSRRREPPDEPR